MFALTRFTYFLLLAIMTSAMVTPLKNNSLKVTINNVNVDQNKIYLALLTEKQFNLNKEKFVTGLYKTTLGSSKTSTVQFNNVPKGTYCLMAYHDQNSNKKLDYNLFDMPVEGFALSNHTKPKMKPTFKSCSFKVHKKEQAININFNYLKKQ